MDLSRRVIVGHATLVFYEFSLAPIAILATFFALFFAGGLISATQIVGEWIGAGLTVVDSVAVVVVTLLVVAMASAGGLAIRGYQRFFDRSFGELSLLPVLVVPLLTLVGSASYAVVYLGTTSPPWWVGLIFVVGVHMLAFRTIAIYAMRYGTFRTGARVGTVAALPATIALVTLVTRHILNGMLDHAGQLIITGVTGVGVPLDPRLLVALPLLIAGAYVAYCIRDDGAGIRLPRHSLPSVPDLNLADRLPGRSQSDRTSGPRNRRARRPSPPPSSPTSSRSRDGQSGSRSAFRGGGGSAANDSDDGTGSGQSSDDEPANDTDSSTDDDGAGSDTRIFTDDFDKYTDGGVTVETCPDCDEGIPSDGVYRYCPQCGCEL